MTEPLLPRDLEMGVATSSWQIEGAVAERGRSIWDDFADEPGRIRDGATGEPACDHVHRLEADLDLIGWLGVDAYRFSISWPRVLPDGVGAVSAEGLGFYDRLVDGLLARGVRPVATLYHWDLPSAVQAATGGWPARDTAARFADYATVVADRLADRVDRWATLNEPWCAAFLGHAAGWMAPGVRDDGASLAAAYHLMLGHGLAVERLRAAGARNVGVVLNLIPVIAEDEGMAEAARHLDGLQNRLFLDLLAGRGVPSDLVTSCAEACDFSFVREGDDAVMAAPIDWLGENYYSVMRVAPPGGPEVASVGQDLDAFPCAPPLRFAPRPPLTDMGWEVVPEGMLLALRQAADALPGVPLWICENGAAYDDDRVGDTVPDPLRVAYYREHLAHYITP